MSKGIPLGMKPQNRTDFQHSRSLELVTAAAAAMTLTYALHATHQDVEVMSKTTSFTGFSTADFHCRH
jgi:hypothetical protein